MSCANFLAIMLTNFSWGMDVNPESSWTKVFDYCIFIVEKHSIILPVGSDMCTVYVIRPSVSSILHTVSLSYSVANILSNMRNILLSHTSDEMCSWGSLTRGSTRSLRACRGWHCINILSLHNSFDSTFACASKLNTALLLFVVG